MSQILRQALAQGALPDIDWMGLREVRTRTTSRSVRDAKPMENAMDFSHGVFVEVLAKGQFGYAATPSTDPNEIIRAIASARAQALRASRFAIHRFTPSARPPVKIHYETPVTRPFDSLAASELNRVLIEISKRLKKSSQVVRTEAQATTIETETRFLSSNGSDAKQRLCQISAGFEVVAQDGPIVQKRSDAGYRGRSYQGGWEQFETPDLWEKVDRVGNQVLELLTAEECPTGKTSLVLMPDQMMLQIHESIGHPLELDRILGDERNYAGWSFVKPEDFGTLQYGSSLMNVSFDPSISHEFASYGFDDVGNPARKELIIRDGILQRGLGGLESQLRSGIPGVANSRASSWYRPPIDRMANLNLEPGRSSFEEIIASVEHGVLMEANRSWSIDDLRNKFQFGCEYGKRIENGRITGTVRNPNYRGITVPFWKSLKMVGDRSTFEVYGTPNCGKGEPNQEIRVGHASPVCLFENIEVFGGAQ